jgi:hypothetical protein
VSEGPFRFIFKIEKKVLFHFFLISTLDGCELSALRSGRFTPGKEPPVPTEEKVGWAPEPIYTLWKREKYLASAWNFM